MVIGTILLPPNRSCHTVTRKIISRILSEVPTLQRYPQASKVLLLQSWLLNATGIQWLSFQQSPSHTHSRISPTLSPSELITTTLDVKGNFYPDGITNHLIFTIHSIFYSSFRRQFKYAIMKAHQSPDRFSTIPPNLNITASATKVPLTLQRKTLLSLMPITLPSMLHQCYLIHPLPIFEDPIPPGPTGIQPV